MKIQWMAGLLAVAGTVFGQGVVSRARISGAIGGQGKCSVEVQIDGTANVEIAGDQGRITALSGGNGQWRKLECNQGLPFAVQDFRFSAQGGRGTQELAAGPNENRGVAVIRVDDPQGGADTYRFEITWVAANGQNGRNNVPGRTGSIFDNDNFPNNNGFPNGGQPSNNDQVNFRAPGDGYLRQFRGGDDQINEGFVQVDRSGRVQVELNTRGNGRVRLTGNVILSAGDRLVANMSGGTMQGAMEILLDARNRVQELAMTGVGRSRFELRWQPR
ncbi:MAG: hypothetical protein RL328_1511 [Acidobacteriota bacterium]|jgi:hypothetical protein